MTRKLTNSTIVSTLAKLALLAILLAVVMATTPVLS